MVEDRVYVGSTWGVGGGDAVENGDTDGDGSSGV